MPILCIMQSCCFHLKNYLRRFREKVKFISLNEPVGEEGSLEDLIPAQNSLFEEGIDDAIFIQQMKEKTLTRRENEVAELLPGDIL